MKKVLQGTPQEGHLCAAPACAERVVFSCLRAGVRWGWSGTIWQPKLELHNPPSFPCPSQASEDFLPQALPLWKDSCLTFPPSSPFLAVLEPWPLASLSDSP